MYFVVGASHRSCSGLIRDRLFTEEAEVPAVLARLKSAGIDQALWLATCDRVEVVAVHAEPAAAALAVTAAMAERVGVDPAFLAGQLQVLTDEAAIRHGFAVASALDSQVIGEPQVLGQVKAAHRLATAAGTTGPELEALLQAAYAVAKRVRSETTIAERPTSIAAAAGQIARDLLGDLKRRAGLLIGLGDMGELMIDQLRSVGLGRLTVLASTDSRAEAAARRLDCHFAPFAALETVLPHADIVVTAAGQGRYILTAEAVRAAVRRRRRQPVFLIDTGVPNDVDPDAGKVEAAFLYDLTDLERVALAGRVGREAATGQAWSLVDEAVAAFLRSRAERAAVPAVVALRRHFEAVRAVLLAENGGGDAAATTRLLINRLLHHPSAVLRRMAAESDGTGLAERAAAERLLRTLFRLDPAEGAADEPAAAAADEEPGS
ncbi:MAG: glutamyl-tRNA reductase [Azospirillum sp.]|nr:glutamyl-tRNA reductase [Azospirillum sp.]